MERTESDIYLGRIRAVTVAVTLPVYYYYYHYVSWTSPCLAIGRGLRFLVHTVSVWQSNYHVPPSNAWVCLYGVQLHGVNV